MTPKDSNSYKNWIEKAERDFQVAKFLFSESDFMDTAGFQLHQAAEKSLKAFLLFHKNEYPLTHNLMHLINQCGIYDEYILDYIDECERINGYYIEARYPADMPINYPKRRNAKSHRDDRIFLDYNTLPYETKEFVDNVKKFYDEYKNKDQSGFIKYFWLIILSVIIVFAGSIIMFKISKNDKKEKIIFANIEMVRDEDKENFYKLTDDLDGDGDEEIINFHFYYGDTLEQITEMEFQGQVVKMQGGAPYGFSKDINGDGFKELIVELSAGVNGIWTEIYKLDSGGKLEIIPTIPEYGSPGLFNKSGIKFVDYDDDGKLEIREDYNYMPDPCVGKANIYEYVNGRFIKSAEFKVYEETCRESMKKVTG